MPEVLATVGAARARLDAERAEGHRIGFVPTMGYLHAGHVALIERAAADNDVVVTSIFVNPLQFAPDEDLAAYPRDPDGDAARAGAAGSGLLFTPSVEEMYPDGRDAVLTSVTVDALTGVMEGASRPTHFAGVCTVVAKLFNVVGPCAAYFGEKDYQQLAIVRRMAADLSFPVDVVGCPTRREADGLALSSRNVYLTDDERAVAPVLHRALSAGADAVAAGERDGAAVRGLMASIVAAAPLGELDYVEVADPVMLRPVDRITSDVRLFGAVRFGRARLIDNVAARPGGLAGEPS
jgi:pantoate--beta-alanine ligase